MERKKRGFFGGLDLGLACHLMSPGLRGDKGLIWRYPVLYYELHRPQERGIPQWRLLIARRLLCTFILPSAILCMVETLRTRCCLAVDDMISFVLIIDLRHFRADCHSTFRSGVAGKSVEGQSVHINLNLGPAVACFVIFLLLRDEGIPAAMVEAHYLC